MSAEEVKDALRERFLDTARWRREKAQEYPADARNLQAAEILEQLVKTVDQVDPSLLVAFGEFFDQEGGSFREFESCNEMLRTVGFHWVPESASEFVTEFVGNVATGRY